MVTINNCSMILISTFHLIYSYPITSFFPFEMDQHAFDNDSLFPQ